MSKAQLPNGTWITVPDSPPAPVTANPLDLPFLKLSGGELSGSLTVNDAIIGDVGESIASASTLDLTGIKGNACHVTGNITIENVILEKGKTIILIFDGTPILHHNALTNNIPSGEDIFAAVNDRAFYTNDGTAVLCLFYQRASGKPVISSTDAAPGVTNYIAEGGKFGTPTGFTLPLLAATESISGTTIVRADSSIILNPRKKALIYDKINGTSDKLEAAYPTAYIDNNTVGFWIFNQPVGSVVPNSAVGLSSIAVANDLTPSGTFTRVDGLADYAIKGDGSTGRYTSANNTGFPIGTSERELTVLFSPSRVSVNEAICGYGTSTSNYTIYSLAGQLVIYYSNSAYYSTGYTFEVGKLYLIDCQYNGTALQVFVNGILVYTLTFAANTAAGIVYISNFFGGGDYSNGTIHYFELRNKCRTPQQIAEIAAKMLFPISWTDSNGERKNLTSRLPSDSIARGYAYADSNGITDYNDSDWGYARREGAYGGNRVVTMDYKLVVTQNPAAMQWTPPFGIGTKIHTDWRSAENVNGLNDVESASLYYDSDMKGVATVPYKNGKIGSYVGATGSSFVNGTWRAGGYLRPVFTLQEAD